MSDEAADGTGSGPGEASRYGGPWTPAALAELRARPQRRRAALAAGALAGLGLAWVHWLGLVAAGALVGLASRDLPRAAAAGLGMGALALAVGVLAAPGMSGGEFLALTPPMYVAIGAGLVAPLWGSLVRGVV